MFIKFSSTWPTTHFAFFIALVGWDGESCIEFYNSFFTFFFNIHFMKHLKMVMFPTQQKLDATSKKSVNFNVIKVKDLKRYILSQTQNYVYEGKLGLFLLYKDITISICTLILPWCLEKKKRVLLKECYNSE